MKIGILGSGAYGFALCDILTKNKNEVTIWSHTKESMDELIKTRQTSKLPNYIIPNDVSIINSIEDTVSDKDLVIVVVPAFSFENTIIEMKKYINKKTPILIATKGIQNETCLFLHEVFSMHLKNQYGVISGPTFAKEMVSSVPIGLSIATKYNNVEKLTRKCFENNYVKFRRSRDVVGVEICGSVKNVIAIASGMLEGMNVSDSTRALFLTESLNDIKELIHALGGKKKTILSFAGFGDILMTCTSKTSRNFSFGYLIGQGATQEEINNYLSNTTVEGMYTLKSIHKLVRKKKVKMPIINLIHNIIIGKKDKEEIYNFLIKK